MTSPHKRGQKIDGWVFLDKPLGLTSTQAIGKVRRLLNAQKAGHAGTLDPLASGVLPIALGEATKTVPYVQDSGKIYRFTVRFGESTQTDDAEGAVIATHPHRPADQAINQALAGFIGTIMQRPPAYSALKIDGQRAYDLARAGAVVDLAPRAVHIEQLALIARPDPDHAEIEVACAKGFYVRALARDLAEALGTVGHVSALRRTAVGKIAQSRLTPLDLLSELPYEARLAECLHPVATVLDDIPALAVAGDVAAQIRNGMTLPLLLLTGGRVHLDLAEASEIRLMAADTLLAIARIEAGLVHPVRVFNL